MDMVSPDVIGLDEEVQKLQVSRLRGLILTIGPKSLRVIVNRNHFGNQIFLNQHNFGKTLNRLHFTSMIFKKLKKKSPENFPFLFFLKDNTTRLFF